MRSHVAFAVWLVSSVAFAQVPIVYSRCPRGNAPVTLSTNVTLGGVTTMQGVTLQSGDLLDALPDTSKQTSNFVAPCDLIFRDADGGEHTLYDCSSVSGADAGCAALDPAVSFDAKTIAFSVFRGPMGHPFASLSPKDVNPAAENTGTSYPLLPAWNLQSTEAQLYLVDVATGTLTPLAHQPGVFDFGPVWLANGRLGFTTDRTNTFRAMPVCTNTNPKSIQYSSMSLDGRDVVRPSPHMLASELHPIPLVDGRVLLSSWQLFGMLSYGHGNSVGGCGTLNNKFHLYAMEPDGSRQMAVYGQHLDDPTYAEHATSKLFTHMAAHFLTQSSDGRIWVDEYYRDNNLGLGVVGGFELPAEGQEGLTVEQAEPLQTSPYRAPGHMSLASFASSADQAALPMPAPAYVARNYANPLAEAGKIGHPAAVPGNRLLITWGKGTCTQATGKSFVKEMQDLAAQEGDNPACDTGIYLTPELPSFDGGPAFSHPSQLQEVVDTREYHEFFARAVVPYRELYGVDAPAVRQPVETTGRGQPELPSAAPFGMLGASSIIHRETKPIGGSFLFEGANQMSHVGTDLIDYTDDELCGVRILAVLPNRFQEYRQNSFSPVGERLGIIGEFPVRKAAGVVDALGQPDTSFKVRLPADVPYLMQGIDCEGRSLNTDQTWQHVAPGEFRTCNGCHVHSAAASALPFSATAAGQGQATTAVLGEGTVPLLAGGTGAVETVSSWLYQVEFERDVMPILAARCVSCHGATLAKAGLQLDVPRTAAMHAGSVADSSTWKRLANDSAQALVPAGLKHPSQQTGLAKPNLSKYVRMLNSRGSLMYWKAANRRTDGRTDADRPSSLDSGVTNSGQFDVDFGAAHPTGTTPAELRIISRWIDTGAGWGTSFTQDTIAPTLTFVGTGDGGSVSGLLVGTTDVGSGIEPGTLNVCVVHENAGGCAVVSAPAAAMAGIVEVPLPSALTEPTDELEVSVGDDAGNTTKLRHSVRYLLGLAPPILAHPGVDGGADDGGVMKGADGGGALQPGTRGACGCGSLEGGPVLAVMAALVLRRRRRS